MKAKAWDIATKTLDNVVVMLEAVVSQVDYVFQFCTKLLFRVIFYMRVRSILFNIFILYPSQTAIVNLYSLQQ